MEPLKRINTDISSTEIVKDFAIQPDFQSLDTFYEIVSSATEDITKTVYEHLANYTQNIRDIDCCGIHQLYSLAQELDIKNLFSFDLTYPTPLEGLINDLSIVKSKLLTTGYVLHNEELQSIYDEFSNSTSGYLYYDISGNLLPETWSQYISGGVYDVSGYYVSGGVFSTVSASNEFSTSGLYLSTSIDTNRYISGFIEPLIKDHLEYYTSDSLSGTVLSGYIEEYRGFLDSIYSNPNTIWFDDSVNILQETTHTLRNICLIISYQRERLKEVFKSFSRIGTARGISQVLEKYILRNYTKDVDWHQYTLTGDITSEVSSSFELQTYLPSVSAINRRFDVQIQEYYDSTEYLNISGGVFNLSGGRHPYWTSDSLADSITNSEHTSAEVLEFYTQLGFEGYTINEMAEYMNDIYDVYSPEGSLHTFPLLLKVYNMIQELSGAYNDIYNVYHNSIPTFYETPASANNFATISGVYFDQINGFYLPTLTGYSSVSGLAFHQPINDYLTQL